MHMHGILWDYIMPYIAFVFSYTFGSPVFLYCLPVQCDAGWDVPWPEAELVDNPLWDNICVDFSLKKSFCKLSLHCVQSVVLQSIFSYMDHCWWAELLLKSKKDYKKQRRKKGEHLWNVML